MPHVLHLLKSGGSATALSVIERQRHEPNTKVTVVLLPGARVPSLPDGITVRRLAEASTPGNLTHSDLLDLIFTADSVVSW